MTDTLLARLAKVDSCAVSDALDRIGRSGVASGLAALTVARRIVGRAVTVQLAPSDGVIAKRHLCTEAVDSAGAHNVLVVAHNGRTDVAGWGGLLSLAASRRGVAGIVIDGACRDIDESRELDLPIYGKGATPVTARGRITELAWNVPVKICGIGIEPGDLIIADGSGVAIIPNACADEVVNLAEGIVARERLMGQAIRQGEPVTRVMGANYETMLEDNKT
jgi:regulator of RNase E activity RraA